MSTSSQGFDADARLMESVPQNMIAVPFGGSTRFVAVASPEYEDTRDRGRSEAAFLHPSVTAEANPIFGISAKRGRRLRSMLLVRRASTIEAYCSNRPSPASASRVILTHSHEMRPRSKLLVILVHLRLKNRSPTIDHVTTYLSRWASIRTRLRLKNFESPLQGLRKSQ